MCTRHREMFALIVSMAVLFGCQSSTLTPSVQKRQATVSKSAQPVAEGSRDLSFKAPSDGQLIAEDQQTHGVVFTKRVRAGQKLDFRADNGTVTLDGRP